MNDIILLLYYIYYADHPPPPPPASSLHTLCTTSFKIPASALEVVREICLDSDFSSELALASACGAAAAA
jgi:hypothetical protein